MSQRISASERAVRLAIAVFQVIASVGAAAVGTVRPPELVSLVGDPLPASAQTCDGQDASGVPCDSKPVDAAETVNLATVAWSCPANLLLNPSFEFNSGSPPTNWTGGTAGTIGVPVPDGVNAGFVSGSGTLYQNVSVTPGYTYTISFYAGSHNPFRQTVRIQYYTSANVAISPAAVHTITADLEVLNGMGGPYALSLGAAPSNASYVRVSASDNGYDYAKIDAACLTRGPARCWATRSGMTSITTVFWTRAKWASMA
jgi:hypothetical protein